MTKEEAVKIRGKEICFLEYYFYPFLDKQFPELNISTTRRIAIALATLCDTDAKAIEEMMQLRYISYKENKDIQWKTEHNIYPHKTTWHEKVYCMEAAKCPVSRKQRRIFLKTLKRLEIERTFLSEEPKFRGKSYYYGPVLHPEHWDAIERIMLLFDRMSTTLPVFNYWNFDEKYKEMAYGRNDFKTGKNALPYHYKKEESTN